LLKLIAKDINENFFEELEGNAISIIEKFEMKTSKIIRITDIK
jgi:hypothetical protein